jgi:hypothetical protein
MEEAPRLCKELLMVDFYSKAEYNQLFLHLQSLQPIALMPTGRTGSDYLHSLFDGHSEVTTFNGHFAWYDYIHNVSRTLSVEVKEEKDVFAEFIGAFIYKFVTKYDIQEKKDQLGIGHDESLKIDFDKFGFHAVQLIIGHELNSRNLLLAIYGAYSLCLGRDVLKTKILLHHPHLEDELRYFVDDFPKVKVLFTVRDIRASLLSQIENFRIYYPKTHDSQAHLYESMRMNLRGVNMIKDVDVVTTSVRLEDLPREDVLRSVCFWMGISWESTMLRPSWGGIEWHGDRLSKKLYSNEWTEDRTYNNWREKLSKRDQLLLRVVAGKMMVDFGYEDKEVSSIVKLLMFVNAIFPMSLELRYLTIKYVVKCIKSRRSGIIQLLEIPLFYALRVKLSMNRVVLSFRKPQGEARFISRP